MSIVTCNGCFDGLHAGHLFYLGYCAAQADHLIVGINSDKYIISKKRPVPIFNEDQRKQALLDLKIVKKVIIFNDPDPSRFIENVCPDVHCTGEEYGNQCIDACVCRELGIDFVLVPRIGEWSTTKLADSFIKEKERNDD